MISARTASVSVAIRTEGARSNPERGSESCPRHLDARLRPRSKNGSEMDIDEHGAHRKKRGPHSIGYATLASKAVECDEVTIRSTAAALPAAAQRHRVRSVHGCFIALLASAVETSTGTPGAPMTRSWRSWSSSKLPHASARPNRSPGNHV